MLTTPHLLQEPIDQLSFTPQFKALATAMGFLTLQDIINIKEKTIMDKPEFTHEWFRELVVFSMDNNIIDELEADGRF